MEQNKELPGKGEGQQKAECPGPVKGQGICQMSMNISDMLLLLIDCSERILEWRYP